VIRILFAQRINIDATGDDDYFVHWMKEKKNKPSTELLRFSGSDPLTFVVIRVHSTEQIYREKIKYNQETFRLIFYSPQPKPEEIMPGSKTKGFSGSFWELLKRIPNVEKYTEGKNHDDFLEEYRQQKGNTSLKIGKDLLRDDGDDENFSLINKDDDTWGLACGGELLCSHVFKKREILEWLVERADRISSGSTKYLDYCFKCQMEKKNQK